MRWSVMLVLFLVVAQVCGAGRPLITDDALPVDWGCVEVELGWAQVPEGGGRASEVPLGLAWGVVPGVEVGVALSCAWEDEGEGGGRGPELSAFSFGGKWLFLPEARGWCDHALAWAADLPTGEAEGVGLSVSYLGTKEILPGMALDAGVGYQWRERESDTAWGGVAWRVVPAAAWETVAELWVQPPTQGVEREVRATLGLRWQVSRSLTGDVGIGCPLEGDGPRWLATVGLTASWGGRSDE